MARPQAEGSLMKKDQLNSRSYPIQEDMRWQRRESLIQRVGEYLLFAIVILGMCGLFSKGFLSHGEARSPDGTLSVDYERFGRLLSNSEMRITVSPQSQPHFTVILGSGALDRLQIQTLQPQPLQATADGQDLRLTYASGNTGTSHTLWLGLQPQASGAVPMTISVDGSKPARFTQWIYP